MPVTYYTDEEVKRLLFNFKHQVMSTISHHQIHQPVTEYQGKIGSAMYKLWQEIKDMEYKI